MEKFKTDVICKAPGCERNLWVHVYEPAPHVNEVRVFIDDDGEYVRDEDGSITYTVMETEESLESEIPEVEHYCVIHGLQRPEEDE